MNRDDSVSRSHGRGWSTEQEDLPSRGKEPPESDSEVTDETASQEEADQVWHLWDVWPQRARTCEVESGGQRLGHRPFEDALVVGWCIDVEKRSIILDRHLDRLVQMGTDNGFRTGVGRGGA